MTAAAQIVVAIFGLLISLASLWGIFATAPLLAAVRGVMDKPWGMPFAILVRIALGVALLLAASASKFPVLFNWLGVLTLIAAVALPVIGRARMLSLLEWFQSRPPLVIRLWLVCGMLFGVFMLYGVVNL